MINLVLRTTCKNCLFQLPCHVLAYKLVCVELPQAVLKQLLRAYDTEQKQFMLMVKEEH